MDIRSFRGDRRSVTAVIALIFLAAAMILQSGTPAQAAEPRQLSAAQLASSHPKFVQLDVATGKITSSWFVTAAQLEAATPKISQRGVCNTGDACYYGKVPYANVGFYGSAGTKNGDWLQRTAYKSGNYRVRACWTERCSPVTAPSTYVLFNETTTGTSFSIYGTS